MKSLNAASHFDRQQNSKAIDALRGYAILLVMGMHVPGHVPTLVWPAKRLLGLGYTGVQLFFIASAVTLMMSWNREQSHTFVTKVKRFFTNRFFRIAPLYYLSIVFYWVFNGMTLADFSSERLFATALFINAWTPDLLPTTDGWMPVPGGWSISVEFMFYLLFPLLALAITTVRRAIFFAVATYVIMLLASNYGPLLYPEISSAAREHFLFFWPPNQLVIFAIGFLLYQCIKSPLICAWVLRSKLHAGSASIMLVGTLLIIQFYDVAFWPSFAFLIPVHFLLAIVYAVWALFMILKPSALAASNIVVSIGKMSFSIYLIHFAVLSAIDSLLTRIWPLGITGVDSLIYAGTLLALSIFVSYFFARVTHRLIEVPFIRYGKSCNASSQSELSVVTS